MTGRRFRGVGCLIFSVIAFVITIWSIVAVFNLGIQIIGAEEISDRVVLTEGIFVSGGLALIGVITGLFGFLLVIAFSAVSVSRSVQSPWAQIQATNAPAHEYRRTSHSAPRDLRGSPPPVSLPDRHHAG